MQTPQLRHMKVVKKIWKYVSGTRDHGILFVKRDELNFMGHVDPDYTSDIENELSTTGFLFELDNNPI